MIPRSAMCCLIALGKGLCVIDLDTVMPGYFISDVGDMMRTYLSPVNEEESETDKIIIRKDFYEAIVQGYLSEMGPELTETEKEQFHFFRIVHGIHAGIEVSHRSY